LKKDNIIFITLLILSIWIQLFTNLSVYAVSDFFTTNIFGKNTLFDYLLFNSIKVFRDLILISITILYTYKYREKEDKILFKIFGSFIIIHVLETMFNNHNNMISLMLLRKYLLVIFALFYIKKFIRFIVQKEELIKILININIISFILSMIIYLFFVFNINNFEWLYKIIHYPKKEVIYISNVEILRNIIPFLSPMILAIYSVFNIFLVYKFKSILSSKLKLFLICINSILLITSFSRTVILAFFISLIFYIFLYRKTPKKKFGIIALVSILAIFGILNLILGTAFNKFVIDTANFKEPSFLTHLSYYKDAFINIKDYILFGYPKGTISNFYTNFSNSGNKIVTENSLFLLLYDYGILGISYLIGILYPFKIYLKEKDLYIILILIFLISQFFIIFQLYDVMFFIFTYTILFFDKKI